MIDLRLVRKNWFACLGWRCSGLSLRDVHRGLSLRDVHGLSVEDSGCDVVSPRLADTVVMKEVVTSHVCRRRKELDKETRITSGTAVTY